MRPSGEHSGKPLVYSDSPTQREESKPKPLDFTVGTDGKTIEVRVSRTELSFGQARRLRDQLSDALRQWKLHDYPHRKNVRTSTTDFEQKAMDIIERAAAAMG